METNKTCTQAIFTG